MDEIDLHNANCAANDAVDLFKKGLYCSEAILQTYNKYLNLGLDEKALKMATGFGAGLGTAKCVCGSLTGAILVISALKGRVNPSENEKEVFELTKMLHDRFKDRFKATCCRVLTRDVEWGTPGHIEFCSHYVHGTVEILEEILNSREDRHYDKNKGSK
jgi:C_GCAxxG_C_C family probable redox protein